MQIGDKVRVKGYYQRNGRKPGCGAEDKSRYRLEECNREGVVAGKRNIHLEGYTDYDEGYYFCSKKIVPCWLVAVSMGQCLYVPLYCVEMLTKETA